MATKVAVIRERFLANSEIANFQVGDGYEITAFGTKRRAQNVDVPIRKLYSSDSITGDRLSKIARVVQSVLLGSSTYLYGLVDELSEFDIIHTIETFQGFSEQAIDAKRKHGSRVVCTVFENIPYFSEPPHYSRTWKEVLKHRKSSEIKRKVRSETDVFIAASDRAKIALEIEGVDPDRIRVIPLGVDTETFHPGAGENTNFNLPGHLSHQHDRDVVFVGRYTWEKGLFDLLTAWKYLQEDLEGTVRLTLVGEGPARDAIQSFAKSASVPNVAVCGPVDHGRVPMVFDAADITVLPSLPTRFWQEQYGRVIVESQACGTPVVASKTGAIPYAMGGHGLLVQPGDPLDWAETLKCLLADEEFRASIAADGRAFVEENRDIEDTRKEIREVYRSLS